MVADVGRTDADETGAHVSRASFVFLKERPTLAGQYGVLLITSSIRAARVHRVFWREFGNGLRRTWYKFYATENLPPINNFSASQSPRPWPKLMRKTRASPNIYATQYSSPPRNSLGRVEEVGADTGVKIGCLQEGIVAFVLDDLLRETVSQDEAPRNLRRP